MKKAIIFDLDNTIYGVPTIADGLFAPLFQYIKESGAHDDNFEAIKAEIMRKPFQVVAAMYHFSEALTKQGMELLSNISYKEPIQYFSDYEAARNITLEKYLVTTGFMQLQQSKIDGMNISKDFKEIHIIDPATSATTKKDVFAAIIQRHGYHINEVLVVGDDLHSEIKAAQDLGIDAIVYDKYNLQPDGMALPKINDFTQLMRFI
ncbi:HAD family hydrolase [Ilyomonas limi]|uniref:HAD family hydrolase n=1 Tax=Ilyomonas limi TaxID=2575867 RepID=A0A4U3L4Y1_9BACT|nr:HAD family hydrolase [Ilyomonas limi]TKK69384.1 HAD family hydrolase [Ilyomonas limi]